MRFHRRVSWPFSTIPPPSTRVLARPRPSRHCPPASPPVPNRPTIVCSRPHPPQPSRHRLLASLLSPTIPPSSAASLPSPTIPPLSAASLPSPSIPPSSAASLPSPTLTLYALTLPPFHRHLCALYLLQRLKACFGHLHLSVTPLASQGTLHSPSSGHQLFISAFINASNCDDTYSNKSWCIGISVLCNFGSRVHHDFHGMSIVLSPISLCLPFHHHPPASPRAVSRPTVLAYSSTLVVHHPCARPFVSFARLVTCHALPIVRAADVSSSTYFLLNYSR
ncbi:hypothetical protein EDB84DRAFT_1564313 [Lactarius hengduanensis]|nr:hypothetical protein EDB84DRAFT_1564313 [Lactarius hengduanensis]